MINSREGKMNDRNEGEVKARGTDKTGKNKSRKNRMRDEMKKRRKIYKSIRKRK